jgi:hypothetical protein
MEPVLLTLAISTLVSIGLMASGVAQRLWPGHPVLVTTLLAAVCGFTSLIALNRHSRNDSGEM